MNEQNKAVAAGVGGALAGVAIAFGLTLGVRLREPELPKVITPCQACPGVQCFTREDGGQSVLTATGIQPWEGVCP